MISADKAEIAALFGGTIRFEGCLEANPIFGQTAASALLRGEHINAPSPMLTQIVLRLDGNAEMQTTRVSVEFPAMTNALQARRGAAVHHACYRIPPNTVSPCNRDMGLEQRPRRQV
jgi:all-trans-8'-apo-beta-carotenal 15,15'-oxygenase